MSGDKLPLAGEQPSGDQAAPNIATSPATGIGGQQRAWGQLTLEEGIRPLTIAAMLACIAMGLAQLVATFAPAWPGRFFTLMAFLVSLEGIHAQRFLVRNRLTSRDRFRFHFVEWVFILVSLRFGVYFTYGGARLASDMAAWSNNMGSFFTIEFVTTSLLILAFWVLAFILSRTMQDLETSPLEKMPSVTDPNHYLRSTMPHQGRTDRQALLNRIVGVYFWGGAFLLFITALARVEVSQLITLAHPRSAGIIINVLAYFALGFLLISHAHYTILRANWELQGIPILGRLGRRWMVGVAAFLLLIGAISALLPVSYSVGILETLFTAVRWIVFAVVQTVFFILFIFSYIFGMIMNLLSGKPGEDSTPTMQRAIPPEAPPAVANEPASWWLVLRSLIFWAVLVAVIGYSVYHFAGDRWGLFRGLTATRLWAWLRRVWQGVRLVTRRAANRLREEIAQRRAARQAKREQDAWRYISLRRLAPRDRVRYFYLSTLRRSSQLGFGRPPDLTPLEYEQALARELPDAAQEVHGLTQAFIEARYSEHSIGREEAKVAQTIWQRVKKALSDRRRSLAALAQTVAEPGEHRQ